MAAEIHPTEPGFIAAEMLFHASILSDIEWNVKKPLPADGWLDVPPQEFLIDNTAQVVLGLARLHEAGSPMFGRVVKDLNSCDQFLSSHCQIISSEIDKHFSTFLTTGDEEAEGLEGLQLLSAKVKSLVEEARLEEARLAEERLAEEREACEARTVTALKDSRRSWQIEFVVGQCYVGT